MIYRLPEPPSANRWWRRSGVHVHKSKEARDYQDRVPHLLRAQGKPEVIRGEPVSLTIHWFRSRRSGDLDKRAGVVLDALQGLLYENDSQIVELHLFRHESPRDGYITVEAACLIAKS